MFLYALVCMSTNSNSVSRCRRRMKVRAVIYLGGVCSQCGYSECMDAMDFHHRDPSQKDFQIGANGIYRRFELLKPELDKCLLLCSNCHRELHSKLRGEIDDSIRVGGRKNVPWPTVEDLTLWMQTEPLVHIAKRLKVAQITVRNWCKVLGVPLRGTSVQPKRGRTTNPLWPSAEDLRRMVWERPVMHLARDIGVSDSAVKKHCRRAGVQTPPRGYWASKTAEAKTKLWCTYSFGNEG